MRKKILAGGIILAVLVVMALGGYKLYRIHERDKCGILLAFDDYSADNWEKSFDLFDKYDVKVTFFINAAQPTDFCYKAKEKGHEIAFHTKSHANLIPLTDEEIYDQAIAPIETFQQEGVELTTFAYPYGEHTEELDEKLLEHYNVLRGAFAKVIYGKHQLRHGFVESNSIDNINYDSQEEYEEYITEILTDLKTRKAGVVSLYSHAIEGGNWCVSEEKLEFLFQKAKELDLEFYTFQELQNW